MEYRSFEWTVTGKEWREAISLEHWIIENKKYHCACWQGSILSWYCTMLLPQCCYSDPYYGDKILCPPKSLFYASRLISPSLCGAVSRGIPSLCRSFDIIRVLPTVHVLITICSAGNLKKATSFDAVSYSLGYGVHLCEDLVGHHPNGYE